MEARPTASLAPLRGRPARLLRIDDSNERYERLRNPFDRELAPRPGRIAAHRGRAREPGDLREPGRTTSDGPPLEPRWAPGLAPGISAGSVRGAAPASRSTGPLARAARAARGPDPWSSCRASVAPRDPSGGRSLAARPGSRRSPGLQARRRCAVMRPGRGASSRSKGFRRRVARSSRSSTRSERGGRPRSDLSDEGGRAVIMPARVAADARAL